MRSLFDEFFKGASAELLAPWGNAQPSVRVSAEPQEADLVFVPNALPGREKELGLLGRIASEVCLLEAFHQPPRRDVALECVRKQLALHHQRTLAASEPLAVVPLWLLSAGRPGELVEALRLEEAEGWPSGVYTNRTSALPVWLVVINELPRANTLLLRVLGAGQVLKQALDEARALPSSSRVREVVLEWVNRLRLDLHKQPASALGPELKEWMMITDAEWKAYKDNLVVEAVAEAEARTRTAAEARVRAETQETRLATRQQDILKIAQTRHGSLEHGATERLADVRDLARLDALFDVALTGTREDFLRRLAAD
jgi:hypothetical protein